MLRVRRVQLEVTGFGVVGTIARRTERCFKRSTFSGTTGSLAASCVLLGVVFEAAGDVAGIVGLGEDKVEEEHRERRVVCQR